MFRYELFEKYEMLIKQTDADFRRLEKLPDTLLLERKGNTSIYYAPFDYLNQQAKVVLVGMTPGLRQAANALHACRDTLRRGEGMEKALVAAKASGSFSGPLRRNLVDMLDYIGVGKWLNIDTTQQLFGVNKDLVHFTSLLRYPVFNNGKNYSGSPSLVQSRMLHRYMMEYFATDMLTMKEAIFIPLGSKVAEALRYLKTEGVHDGSRILEGIPHPSGANTERILYFLGRKHHRELSSRTNPEKIDSQREALLAKMAVIC